MTFRGKLRLFFGLIVVVPLITIAAVLFELTGDSERGKTDARLANGLDSAIVLYRDGREAARDHARTAAAKAALKAPDARSAQRRLSRLAAADRRIVSATISDGGPTVRVGSPLGIAAAAYDVTTPADGTRSRRTISVTSARALVRAAERRLRPVTSRPRLGFMVLRDGKPVASTVPGVRAVPGKTGDFEAGGRAYRGGRALAGRPDGVAEEIAVFQEASHLNSSISASRTVVGAIVVAFFALALGLSVLVVRELHGRIGTFLAAARRLAGGRFDQPVQVDGNDEFAELGREFNSMAQQLAAKIREVEGKSLQLQQAVRRVGNALSAGLDAREVLDVTAQSALAACDAEAAHATFAADITGIQAGSNDARLTAALAEGETLATDPRTSDRGSRPVTVGRDGVHALAVSLRPRVQSRDGVPALGVLGIARLERAFSPQEAELLKYLAGQAEVSIEHARLHAEVQRQARTDGLTGLWNREELERVMERELERRRRFGTSMGFVSLDIDSFKNVNDTYGHSQGDAVLVAVARVLAEHTRGPDEPGRWGGEEFAVVLPETDIDEATPLAERIRAEIAALRIPRLDGRGEIRVTASLGVGSVPECAETRKAIVDIVDDALYRAKRAGKNRVERAAVFQP